MADGADEQAGIARVVLHKHGMGFFERRARVEDDAELELSFRHDEMDDVLKSLAFSDGGSGRLASVSYDPHPDLAQRVDDIRVALPQNGGLVALLEQLRGAELALRVAGEELQGRVLGVERVEEVQEETLVSVEMISLAVGDGLRRIRLADVDELRPFDPALRRDLAVLFERSDARRRSERRRLRLQLRGAGEREVCIAYTVPATVWKTTYRIVFEDETRPRLLGFAVVDNDGPDDWEAVDLSLVSGLPVSFTHDLYSPRRRKRPHVRVESEAPIAPPVLQPTYEVANDLELSQEPVAAGGAVGAEEGLVELDDCLGEEAPGAVPAMGTALRLGGDLTRDIEVATRTEEQGDLFRYDVTVPVSIPSGSSALVPILSEEVEGEIVSVYNESVRKGNPIASFRLTNTSDLTLESGPATVLRAGEYAGEAMLDSLRPGEETLVPFSVELGCRVTTDVDTRASLNREVRVAGGKLHCVNWAQRLTTYTLRNTTQRCLVVLIDHPAIRHGNAELVDMPDPVERTEAFDRFRVEVAAGAQLAFPVTERIHHATSQALGYESLADQVALVESIGASSELLGALRDLEPIAARLADASRERKEIDETVKEIGRQHDRIRKNLAKLDSDSQKERDLRDRYIETLDNDETRLEEIGTRREELQAEITSLQRRFSETAMAIRSD